MSDEKICDGFYSRLARENRMILNMLDRRPGYEPTAYDDDWEDLPSAGALPKWGGGIAVPLLLIGYGLHCIITGHGLLPGGRSQAMDLTGANATALGLACITGGMFLHCHYFWGNIYHLAAWAVLGKIGSFFLLIGSLGYLLWHVGVLGH